MQDPARRTATLVDGAGGPRRPANIARDRGVTGALPASGPLFAGMH